MSESNDFAEVNEFEHRGEWWIPENPDNTLSGVIKFNYKEGGTLELLGNFEDIREINSFEEGTIINGTTVEGKKITLWKCYRLEGSFSQTGLSSSKYFIQYIMRGIHFETEDEIEFNEMLFNYSHVNNWIGRLDGRESTTYHKYNDHSSIEINRGYPPLMTLDLTEFEITIIKDNSIKFRTNELIAREETLFIFKTKKKEKLVKYIYEYNYQFQNFLTLILENPISIQKISGKNDLEYFETPSGDRVLNDIDIFFKFRGSQIDSQKGRFMRNALKFAQISETFEHIIKLWFDKSEILQPTYDLYFSIEYNPYMYLQTRFLSLTQALESYHRRTRDGKYCEEDDYNIIKEALQNAIPTGIQRDLRQSLENKIRFGNEFSLRRRIKDIIREINNVHELPIDIGQFAGDVVATRNYLVHYTEELRADAKDNDELYKIVIQLKIIIEICFLIEIEIPQEVLVHAIKRKLKSNNLS